MAAIWGAIFRPQEVPADFLALSKMDCQQHSYPTWLMNPVGEQLDKLLWAPTGKHSQEVPLKRRAGKALSALLAGLAVCC
jgi:hypothetical protein